MKKILAISALTLAAMSGCADDGTVVTGEGEGDTAEGEGDTAEGEGDTAEGEGDTAEGEGDIGGEGEGEGPNARNNPLTASLPFEETIAIPTTEVCYRVTASIDGFIRTGITTPNCAARDLTEDTRIDVVLENSVVSNDDGGDGYCAYTDVPVAVGDVVVVCFYEGPRFSDTTGNPIAAADVFIEETAGPSAADALCRNASSFGNDARPFLECDVGFRCLDVDSGATRCTAVTLVPVGEPCDPTNPTQFCDAPLEDDVRCRFDGTASLCSAVTRLVGGDGCVVDSEIAICESPFLCVDGACTDALLSQCLAAPVLSGPDADGDGVFTATATVTTAETVELSCGFSTSTAATRYTATVDGILEVQQSGFSTIALVAEDCAEQLSCGSDAQTLFVTAGQTVVAFIDGMGEHTLEFLEAQTVAIAEGGACPTLFNEICDTGTACNGTTCVPTEQLSLPANVAFSLAVGEVKCFDIALDGPTEIETSGACASTGDSRFFVFKDGIQIDGNDDAGDGSCSLLTRSFTAGTYVVCVEEFLRNAALDVTLTIQ
jgi:hypothetical protein